MPECAERVRRLARLADRTDECSSGRERVAVTPFAGDVDLAGDACPTLEERPRCERSVVGGAARNQLQPFDVPDAVQPVTALIGGDGELSHRPTERGRLVVNLFQHQALELAPVDTRTARRKTSGRLLRTPE